MAARRRLLPDTGVRRGRGRHNAALFALVAAIAWALPAALAQSPRPAAELIDEFVVANRILADQGVIADGFGHLSARSPADPNRFYMSRARAAGLVTPDDVMEFDLDAKPLDQQGRRIFSERFIHAEIYRARPEVNAVVHSHAPSVIPFGVTGTPLRPVSHMAGFLVRAVPVFEIREAGGPGTDMLVKTAQLGAALAKKLGPAPAVLMRGHGFNAVGTSIRQAVSRAVYTDLNARVLAEALRMGTVTYLNENEAAMIAETNDASIERSWEIWKIRALANTPKL
jgi:ribulose-5-phosphate 4-epimerase/fuculose-1-phosphate aldolase